MDKKLSPELIALRQEVRELEEALKKNVSDVAVLKRGRDEQAEGYIRERTTLKKLGFFALIRDFDLWKKVRRLKKELRATEENLSRLRLSKVEKDIAMKSRIDEYLAAHDREHKMLAVIHKALDGLNAAAESYKQDLCQAYPLFTAISEFHRLDEKILDILGNGHSAKKIDYALKAVRDAGRFFSEAVKRYYDQQNPRFEDGVRYSDAKPWEILTADGSGTWDLIHRPYFMGPFEFSTLGQSRQRLIELENTAHAVIISIEQKKEAVVQDKKDAHKRITMAVCDMLWWDYHRD